MRPFYLGEMILWVKLSSTRGEWWLRWVFAALHSPPVEGWRVAPGWFRVAAPLPHHGRAHHVALAAAAIPVHHAAARAHHHIEASVAGILNGGAVGDDIAFA